MCYGASLPDLARGAGKYVAKILSVKPPDEDETERDELCPVCLKLPPAPEGRTISRLKATGLADRVCYRLRHCRRSK